MTAVFQAAEGTLGEVATYPAGRRVDGGTRRDAMTAQADLGVQVAWRSERRSAAHSHHPDLGGDAQEYLRVIAAIDARYGLCVDPGGSPQRPVGDRTTTGADPHPQPREPRAGVRRTRRRIWTLPTRGARSLPRTRRFTTL